MRKANVKSKAVKKGPTIKELADIIAKAIASSNGKANHPQWGVPIATSKEEVQYNLIALKLKRNLQQAISITVDKKHGIKGTKTHSENEKWPKEWHNIDMIIEFQKIIYLLEFKLLRPVGAQIRRMPDDFIKPFFTFDSAHPESGKSIIHDIIKLNKLGKYEKKKIKKYVIAIYYPTSKIDNSRAKLIKKIKSSKILGKKKIIEVLQDDKAVYNNSERNINMKAYKSIFVGILKTFKIMSKMALTKTGKLKVVESALVNINWNGLKKTIIRAKNKNGEPTFNLSYLFHKKVKVFGWEVK